MFDQWRQNEQGVLKTLEDWQRWETYKSSGATSAKGLNRSKGGQVVQAKRLVLQAHALKAWGLPGGDYNAFADHLSDNGFDTKENDLKNARRRKRELLEHEFTADDDIVKLAKVVFQIHPTFDWTKLFKANLVSTIKIEID